MKSQELLEDDRRLETDGVGVAANEGATKNPEGPVRDVVALEVLEQGRFDLRLLGDGRKRNLLLFTPLAQSGA